MSTQPSPFAEIIEAFREIRITLRENAERMAETDQKIAEQIAEADRKYAERIAETDRQIKATNHEIGKLGSRVGDLVEHMIGDKNVVE